MSIKFKLLLIAAGITVAMLLSIISMRWSITSLNSLTETQELNQNLLSNMLILRRNEKDFILRNDLKYLDKFNKNQALMQENISRLGELIAHNNINNNDFVSLSSIIKNYQSSFHQLVDTSRQIGLNPESGLRGTLRGSVHKAEEVFKTINNYKLFKDMLMLRRNEKDFLMRKDNKYIDKFNNNFLIFLDDINHSDLNEKHKTQLLKDIESYKKAFLQLTSLEEKRGINHNSGIQGEMRSTIHQSEGLLKKVSESIEESIQSTSHSIQMFNTIVSLVIAVLVIGLTFFLAQTISHSLKGFMKTLNKICDTGNLALRVENKGKDEISQVGMSLNNMLTKFQEIVHHLHGVSTDLTQYSQQFRSTRENTCSNVEKQQLETGQVIISISEMSTSARSIANNTTRTADAAQLANTMTNEGKSIVDSTIQATQSLEHIINNASSIIQQLGENSNSIGSILDVIRGIAEQTNLLALNAAIEAARAGEQGRGFAVVADEVRSLAQKTQDSISEIESMIASLQSGSHKAIEAIAQGKESVSNNVQHINNAGNSLSKIVTELSSINQMSKENALATKQQSSVAEEVNENVVTIKNLGTQIVDNIDQLKHSSDKMASISTELSELVKDYQV